MNIGRVISGIILIAIALVGLDMLTEFLNPPVDETETVSMNGSYTYQATLMGDDVMEGEFTVENDTVTFFICDEENYDKYKESGNYSDITAYKLMEDVSSGKFEFTTPEGETFYETKTWHVVYDTSNSTGNSIDIESHIEYDPYRTILGYVKIIFLVIGAVRIIQGFLPKKRKVEEKENGEA